MKRLLFFLILFITLVPIQALANGNVSLYQQTSSGVSYLLTGTGWSYFISDQTSSGGYKNSQKFQRPSGSTIHVNRCNGSTTYTFFNSSGQVVKSQTVTVSGITNESTVCNPPEPTPPPPAPKPIVPKPVPAPAPVKNEIVKVPPIPPMPPVETIPPEKVAEEESYYGELSDYEKSSVNLFSIL